MQFVQFGDAASRDRGLLFDLKPAGGAAYVLHDPNRAFDMTGTFDGGTIVFAGPPPSPARFQISFSDGGRAMHYVAYSINDFGIFRKNHTTDCTR